MIATMHMAKAKKTRRSISVRYYQTDFGGTSRSKREASNSLRRYLPLDLLVRLSFAGIDPKEERLLPQLGKKPLISLT